MVVTRNKLQQDRHEPIDFLVVVLEAKPEYSILSLSVGICYTSRPILFATFTNKKHVLIHQHFKN